MHPSTRQLNDFVDGELPAAEEAMVRAHVATCRACRTAVDQLGELKQVARTLGPLEPPVESWAKVKGALDESPVNRRLPTRRSRAWLWAAAAVVALAIGGGFLTRNYLSRGELASGEATEIGPEAREVEAELAEAERHYQNAIAALEKIANAEQGTFDPKTAAALQKNLAVVDQAISESRAALKAQPTSESAQQSLLDSFKAKVSLLQYTVALINEMRKGDEAGAARVASGIKRGS